MHAQAHTQKYTELTETKIQQSKLTFNMLKRLRFIGLLEEYGLMSSNENFILMAIAKLLIEI
jgi:hypothetical protein